METNGWKSKAQVKSLQRFCSQSHTLPTQQQQFGLQVLFCCVLITITITQTALSSPSWSHSIKKVRTEHYSQQLNRFLRNILTVLLCHSPFQMSLMLNARFLSFFLPLIPQSLCVWFSILFCTVLLLCSYHLQTHKHNIYDMIWSDMCKRAWFFASLLSVFQFQCSYFNSASCCCVKPLCGCKCFGTVNTSFVKL